MKTNVIRKLEKIALTEEISWRKKYRVLWLKEGDKCTKVFHHVANSNRSRGILHFSKPVHYPLSINTQNTL
jgi:hypothetical protein